MEKISFMPMIFFAFAALASVSVEYDAVGKPFIKPRHLDSLLRRRKYDKFEKLMGIPKGLSRSYTRNDENEILPKSKLNYGDILLTPLQKAYDSGQIHRHGVNFQKSPNRKWEKVIPYYVSPKFNGDEKNRIERAIAVFNAVVYPCVQWVPYAGHKDYVYIFPGDWCYSMLGRIGGQQSLSLEKPGCLVEGIILHELNHAVGILHEQSRPDRDHYIRVLWENIDPGWQAQYKKTNLSEVKLTQRYDYYSVMHYRQNGANGRPRFLIRRGRVNPSRIGQRNGFSELDKLKLRNLYCARR